MWRRKYLRQIKSLREEKGAKYITWMRPGKMKDIQLVKFGRIFQ